MGWVLRPSQSIVTPYLDIGARRRPIRRVRPLSIELGRNVGPGRHRDRRSDVPSTDTLTLSTYHPSPLLISASNVSMKNWILIT